MPQLAPAPPRLNLPSLTPSDPFVTPPIRQQPAPPAAPPPPPTPKSLLGGAPKRSGRRKTALIVGLLLVLLGLGGGALAFYVWQQQARPAVPPAPVLTPEQVLQQAWEKLLAVPSLHAEYSLKLNVVAAPDTSLSKQLQGTGTANGQTELTMTITADTIQGAEPKGSGVMTLSVPINVSPVPGAGAITFTPRVSFVSASKNVTYVKLDNLGLLLGAFGAGDVDGAWVKIDLAALTGVPGVSQQELDTQRAQSERMTQEAKARYAQYPFFAVAWADDGAAPPGSAAPAERQLKFSLQPQQFEQFIAAFWTKYSGEFPAIVTAEELATMRQTLAMLKLDGVAQIGTADQTLHGLNFTAVVTPVEAGVPQGTVTLTATAQFSKFNEPVAIAEPTEFLTVEEFTGKAMEAFSKQRQPPQPDAREPAASDDSDNDGLPDAAEKNLGTDPQQSDTDGDGFDDGTEVKNGFNPLGPGKMESSLE